MEGKSTVLVLVAMYLTSSSAHDGDLLHAACSEACQDWEDWRKQCFEAQCGEQVKAGEDWFPCYLQCWNKARACVTLCAESFWSLYSTCSRHCLDLAATDTRQCRQACIVTEFTAVRNKSLPAPPSTVDPPTQTKSPETA